MALQFRRGTSSERLQAEFIPLAGEPIYEIDTAKLYIGDGATVGGVPAIQGFSITDCSDINLISDFTFAISSYSVSNGVATVTFDAAHPFQQNDQINIVSSSVTDLLGIYNVSSVTNFTVTFLSNITGNVNSTFISAFASLVLEDGEILVYDRNINGFRNGLPVTNVASLTDVALSSPESGQILIYDGITNKWENGPVATTLDGLTDVTLTDPVGNGEVLSYDSTTSSWKNVAASGLSSREAFSVQATLAGSASTNLEFNGFKSYVLLSIQTDNPAWVVVYTSLAARSNDSTRSQYADPLPGSGVIAEIITSAATTQVLTPGTIGFNSDAIPTDTVYLKVQNQQYDTSATINVTLTLLRLEA